MIAYQNMTPETLKTVTESMAPNSPERIRVSTEYARLGIKMPKSIFSLTDGKLK